MSRADESWTSTLNTGSSTWTITYLTDEQPPDPPDIAVPAVPGAPQPLLPSAAVLS
jgi:hypothetical protein